MAGLAHVPVMADRVLTLLAPALDRPGAVFVDATLGLGGHTSVMLENLPSLRVVALDRDLDAIAASKVRLSEHAARVTFVHAVYDELPSVLSSLGLPEVEGILFDLGVSSMQLDQAERGFAYAIDAPLDMRMDQSSGRTAAEVLNTYSSQQLMRILRDFGEERFASRIADAIVRARSVEPFTTSAPLVELVRSSIPAATRRVGGNPAKRTFQALRIEVNAELDALARAIPSALAAVNVRGRLAVLAYHSLEDRLVKRQLAAVATSSAPPDMPVVPDEAQPQFRLLTRGAEKATADEVASNPRAASVRLRAAERVRAAA